MDKSGWGKEVVLADLPENDSHDLDLRGLEHSQFQAVRRAEGGQRLACPL